MSSALRDWPEPTGPRLAAVTDADVQAYAAAARRAARDVPGDGTNAVRAGLAAVLDGRRTVATGTIHAGLMKVETTEEYEQLRRSGWQLVGVGVGRQSGVPVYVLERAAPSTEDGAR